MIAVDNVVVRPVEVAPSVPSLRPSLTDDSCGQCVEVMPPCAKARPVSLAE